MWTERPKIVPDRPFPPPSPNQIQRLRDRTSIPLSATCGCLNRQQVDDSWMKPPHEIHISISKTNACFNKNHPVGERKKFGMEHNTIQQQTGRHFLGFQGESGHHFAIPLHFLDTALKPFGGLCQSIIFKCTLGIHRQEHRLSSIQMSVKYAKSLVNTRSKHT